MVYCRATICILVILVCGCSSTSVSRISVTYKPNIEQQVQIDISLDRIY